MADSPAQIDLVLAGRYRLVRTIARGGMAEVWEGYDERLARPVAVKILHAHLAADAGFRDRFRREAIAAARLIHPGIVATYDTGIEGDTAFIVMELARGANLRDLLRVREGPLACREVVDLGAQVADALHFAHEAGLVHRDVKPANILCEEGRAKVADFGIAKVTEVLTQTGAGAGGELTDLTNPGAMIGTAAYLSPEQVEGEPVDRRADVYALGVVLYELLTGRQPFQGDGELAVALQRLGGEPLRPRQLRAGIPRPLEQVVLRAMARDPGDRYPTAADLRSALLAVDLTDDDATPLGLGSVTASDDTPPGGISPSFRQSERSWLLPAAVILLLGAALIVVGFAFAGTDVGRQVLGRTHSTTAPRTQTTVAIASVSSFDPEGSDRTENEAEARRVIDGDPTTAWRTDRYNRADLGGLKPGVGLVLRLGHSARPTRLEVTSTSKGWSAQVFVADRAGTTLADWGRPVATHADINGSASFDLGRHTGGAVLLWITTLGDGPPRYSTSVGEVRVFA